jgi:hypothetical protein
MAVDIRNKRGGVLRGWQNREGDIGFGIENLLIKEY